jgi:hypothetical protein
MDVHMLSFSVAENTKVYINLLLLLLLRFIKHNFCFLNGLLVLYNALTTSKLEQ